MKGHETMWDYSNEQIKGKILGGINVGGNEGQMGCIMGSPLKIQFFIHGLLIFWLLQ